jgi:protein-tyrosine phosphatase
MRPSIYWLDLPNAWRLAIMPRPRAGDWLADEITGWRAEGVQLVVCLLEAHEVAELALADERALCQASGIELISFPVADRGVPTSVRETEQIARRVSAAIADGKAGAIHCRAGIGRSSLIAACVLVLNGYDAPAAFDIIARARGLAVPDTAAQRAWVSAFQAALHR